MYNQNYSNRPQRPSSQDQVEVTIRNLPNEAKTDDILEYLSIAGPIKTHRFLKEEERYSAILTYHDAESAQLCKKYLGDRYYKGRVLTITSQIKKNYQNPNNGFPSPAVSYDDELARQIAVLRPEEKKMMLGLMKSMKNQGTIFQSFMMSKPKIVSALLGNAMIQE